MTLSHSNNQSILLFIGKWKYELKFLAVAFSGGKDIGGNPCGIFGGTA